MTPATPPTATDYPIFVPRGTVEPEYGAPFGAPGYGSSMPPIPPAPPPLSPPPLSPPPLPPPALPMPAPAAASGPVARPGIALAAPTSIMIGLTRIAFGVGLVGAWCILFVVGLSGIPAARSQQIAYGQLRANLAQEVAPIGGAITPGTPIALLEAPSIDLRYVVVEGTSAGDLERGPGHLRSTPLPGQAGVSVLFGRSFAYGGPFRRITDLRPGATITVTTQQGTFTYRVDRVRRAGDPVPDPAASDAGRLTLVTAEGVSWRAGWVPDQAVYVDTTLAGPTVPTPAGRPSVVPAAEAAMQGDVSARFPLVLWLQLLLIAAVGVVWAQSRWGGAQAWLVGTPIVLAVLFGVSQTAAQLLPNLL